MNPSCEAILVSVSAIDNDDRKKHLNNMTAQMYSMTFETLFESRLIMTNI